MWVLGHVLARNNRIYLVNRFKNISQRRNTTETRAKVSSEDSSHKYSSTLNLPKTSFSLRANAATTEPLVRDRITKQLYAEQNAKSHLPLWVTHDGPPYANGVPHIGHALNKILKDIVNRHKVMMGYRVNYIPGWDCHGLPIESKALSKYRETLEREKKRELTPEEMYPSAEKIRKQARILALQCMDQQKKEFMSWGIMGDWENPYRTMDFEYEATELEIFRELFKKGCIYRAKKPVYWSPANKTALAEAELEYNNDHKSTCAYVTLRISNLNEFKIKGLANRKDENIYLSVWTTTPWTLPANRAVCVNPNLEYTLAYVDKHRPILIAESLISQFENVSGCSLQRTSFKCKGEDLVGLKYIHPFDETLVCPVLSGNHVTALTGTGLVHTAPGHGMEDFGVCSKHNIDPFSPVDDDGVFTAEVGEKLRGLHVLTEGNKAVLSMLTRSQALLHSHEIIHKYPYDWRSKTPVIVRATKQWFADVTHLVPLAVQQLENINFIPATGKNRLEATLKSRNDWCISRQRAWGVPIPVLYDTKTGEPLITEENISHIASIFRNHGSHAWFTMDDQQFIAPKYLSANQSYTKGKDTVDVWFDSGVSWCSVLQKRKIADQADLYIEGSDQHRGWFQSSILTSVGATGKAPYKNLVTHGFVLDQYGRKMSKSLGNVIGPDFVIRGGQDKVKDPAYGVDILRMWVASSNYSGDIHLGSKTLRTVFDNSKRIRNTIRFMLSNLYDVDTNAKLLSPKELLYLDSLAMHRIYQFIKETEEAYEQFNFPLVTVHLHKFASQDMSSFYFESLKDRLYADSPSSVSRRSAQTVLFYAVQAMTKLLAPIAPHTAEDAFLNLPTNQNKNTVFDAGYKSILEDGDYNNVESMLENWNKLIDIRGLTTKAVEECRSAGTIVQPLDAAAELQVSKDAKGTIELLSKVKDQLHLLLGVSQAKVTLIDSQDECKPVILKSHLIKCSRCWLQICESEADICKRCSAIVHQ